MTATGSVSSKNNAPYLPLVAVMDRNIATLVAMRQKTEQAKGVQERAADAITTFTGSMVFVYVHLIWFGGWIVYNLVCGRLLHWTPFDPYPFGLLTMIGSLEAIFLSTFVLISQNRMAAAADRRAELDLQINLLAEHEITQVLTLVDAMAQQMGIHRDFDPDIEESKLDVDPAIVIEEIERREQDRKAADITEKP